MLSNSRKTFSRGEWEEEFDLLCLLLANSLVVEKLGLVGRGLPDGHRLSLLDRLIPLPDG